MKRSERKPRNQGNLSSLSSLSSQPSFNLIERFSDIHNIERFSSIRRIESAVDASIPYLLVALVLLTVIELFSPEIVEAHFNEIAFADNSIAIVFAADLLFKYSRSKNLPQFVKRNWIDILAVMPFYMMFRLLDEFLAASDLVNKGQQTIPLVIDVEREAAKDMREIKEAKLVSRSERMLREIRILSRFPRLAKAAHFFEKPDHKTNHKN